ncbi:CapA family protein [Candidatus Desantisbacteria bacterium]|nr:CapA family protein [Candidatus Desantisbacteria bacterium]
MKFKIYSLKSISICVLFFSLYNYLFSKNIESKKQEITLKKDIENIRKKVDFVIVSMHWGTEYQLIPTEKQKEIAHKGNFLPFKLSIYLDWLIFSDRCAYRL